MDIHHVIHHAGSALRGVIFLHGSSQDETSLIALAEATAPGRPHIFLRGQVPWEDGYAFFRRHDDRRIDIDDLQQRLGDLTAFLSELKKARTLTRTPFLVGYSNGAIMAEALLRTAPQAVAGAVLIRPLSPELTSPPNDLSGKPVLILAGSADDRRSPDDAERCDDNLRQRGAVTQRISSPIGHIIGVDEPDLIRDWIAANARD